MMWFYDLQCVETSLLNNHLGTNKQHISTKFHTKQHFEHLSNQKELEITFLSHTASRSSHPF